ncbi:ScyA-related TPP-binding enzyme [Nostoc sp. 106C]|uniref:ScyA-related TPP-binding enzyme n=1 Tax=Nostoc sp. 106C TaxID=1932667 RepID=UPI000A37B036|nr:ScyA-related TPP-binding enzyme [Nostoc sp. 106C]OUL28575.1 acetolactate synthase [Nostoc sp. 106C]
MNIESFPDNTTQAENLKDGSPIKFTSGQHTTINDESGFGIFDASKSSLTVSPLSLVPSSVASAIVKRLEEMGVQYAFGVSGGAIVPVWHALQHSSIKVLHFRHEAGAAFAATEAYFASDRPVVVFSTTGPGITNSLTGLLAARWEGAKVIFLSASTSASQRGRWACQETSSYTMAETFTLKSLFHYATTLESDDELPEVYRRLAKGLAQPGGFIAHISIPTNIQASSIKTSLSKADLSFAPATASEETISKCVRLLSLGSFAIWVGFGATDAAAEIRQFAEKTGAAVMCSPRGKGIFPENHPQFVGVTGLAGHESVLTYMQKHRPLRVLVLGTRLGEFTSFWNPAMIPLEGFLHVDIDPEVLGTAYPGVKTLAIQSDVKALVQALLKHLPKSQPDIMVLPRPERQKINPRMQGLVRPQVLMDAIQQVIVDRSDAIVMTEAGNSMAWGNQLLQFTQPSRYRTSTGFASVGHFVTGVVGATLARNGKAVAIVGDGAMLMNSEVSTAVRYQIPAVWIILNDGCYNMCGQGSALQGFDGMDVEIPQVDFVKIACGMGADGIRVEKESDICIALEKAIASPVPFIVDVIIDPTEPAPLDGRINSLISQGITNS